MSMPPRPPGRGPRPGARRGGLSPRPADRLPLAVAAIVVVLALALTGSVLVSTVRDMTGGAPDPTEAAVPPASVPTPTGPAGEATVAVSPGGGTPPVADEEAQTLGEPYVVCLDVGHGGIDQGFTRVEDGETVARESDLVLDIAERIQTRLEAQGVEVVLTRTTDSLVNPTGEDVNGDGEQAEDVDGDGLIDTPNVDVPNNLDELQARVDVCNEAGANLLISVHINGAENTDLQGYEAWWADGRPFSDQSQWFAEEIVDQFGQQFEAAGFADIQSRGAASDEDTDIPAEDLPSDAFVNYVVLAPDNPGRDFTGSTMPGAVVESLFMSSDSDWEVLGTEEGIESIVQSYVVAINAFFTEFPIEGRRLSTGEAGPPPVGMTTPAATPVEVAAAPSATYEYLPTPAVTDPISSYVVETWDTDRPEIALTFDCGADRGFTPELLDLLADYGIPASFGMTGLWADQNPDLVRRMIDEGHQVFNHTYSHGSFTGRSTDGEDPGRSFRLDELARTDNAIADITGGYRMQPYWRPPYGDLGPQTLADAAEMGYGITVMWTVDTLGWNGMTGPQVAERVIDTMQPGQIVLMHVGVQAQGDFDSLPTIIETAEADGYTFVTVATMMQPDGASSPAPATPAA